MKIAVEIAFGISHLHKQGIIHRNLNVHNIMLNRFLKAKIINFGQVHCYESISNESNISMTKNIGDFIFMSPEMQNDDDEYDIKTDVYSYGVIIYNLFTGKLPKFPPSFPLLSQSISICCIEPSERPSFNEILVFICIC